MTTNLVMFSAFACVSLGVLGFSTLTFDLYLRDRQRLTRRFREAFPTDISDKVRQSPLFKDLQQLSLTQAHLLPGVWTRIQTWIDQAGITLPASHLPWACLAVAGIAGPVMWLIADRWWLAAIAAATAAPSPIVWVLVLRARRLYRLCQQLPGAFDAMSRALKAGQTVSSSFQVIAVDFPRPISEEFAYCYEQQQLGIAYDVALRDLARRTGVMELQIFVVALIVNRKTGGNLSELLSKLAYLVRQRIRLKGRIKALTGEGRMQAAVLLALPPLAFLAMLLVNREYAQALLDRPRMLALAALVQVVGAYWIHRIVNFEV